eukprot:9884270-Lingulodinium_polyedra.AAC.1
MALMATMGMTVATTMERRNVANNANCWQTHLPPTRQTTHHQHVGNQRLRLLWFRRPAKKAKDCLLYTSPSPRDA